MKKIILLIIVLTLSSCTMDKEVKYLNQEYSIEVRLNDLMSRMTLEEKVAQMTQFVGLNYITDADRNMTAEEILNSDSRASYRGLLKRILLKWLQMVKLVHFYMF